MANYQTKAGLSPSQNTLTYRISTSDVEKFLQDKMNIVVQKMRDEGYQVYTTKSDQPEIRKYNGPNIDVNLIGINMSSVFVPFTVILPMDVIVERKKKKKEELSIFDPKGSDGTLNLYLPIARLLAAYSYNKEDTKAFFSPDWRRARKIPNSVTPTLKYNATPKVQRVNQGKDEVVTLMLDPIRMFHDMLKMEDNRADFHVEIVDIQRQREGEFLFTVDRVLNKKKKNGKGGRGLVADITRKMMGNR